MIHEPMRTTGTATSTSTARDAERIDALVELGIDSPLKLDLVATIEQGGGAAQRGPDGLAALCGVSPRDVVPTLAQLERARLVECRRFYNISEYVFSGSEELRSRVRSLIGVTPAEMRRLRRGLLARLTPAGR